MKLIFILFFAFISLKAYTQNKIMVINKDASIKIEKFKKSPKFKAAEKNSDYTGLSEPKLQPLLTKFLIESADDFLYIIHHGPNELKFQTAIQKGLNKFNPYYLDLDTEDREKVCTYYEELMDDVGLESSGGILNKWLYGFDPEKH